MNDLSKRLMSDFIKPNKYANTVTGHTARQFELMEKDIELDLSNSKQILDIGCGTGELTRKLVKMSPDMEVTGADLSEDYVEYCTKHADDPRLKYITLDAAGTWPEDLEFDMILSTAVVHRIANHRPMFENFHKVLRVNGEVAINFNKQFVHMLPILKALKKSDKWEKYLNNFPIENTEAQWDEVKTYKNMIEEIGFEVKKCRFLINDVTFLFDDKEDAIQNIIYWFPALKYIPEEMHREIIVDFIDHLPKQEDKILLSLEEFIVHAVKL